MKKSLICLTLIFAMISTAFSVFATEGSEDTTEAVIEYTWDMTALTEGVYNADEYIAVGEEGIVSVKSAQDYVTSDGVKATKKNNVRIRIVPPVDGNVIITYTGGTAVMPEGRENRAEADTAVPTDTAVAVTGSAEYYLQGANSSESVIKSISFTNKKAEPDATTAPSETQTPDATGEPVTPSEINIHTDGIWDLTQLFAHKDSFTDYAAVDDIGMISVKSIPESITVDGVSAGKSTKMFIKITPTADGLLTATYTGTGGVVMSPKESRSSSDPNIISGVPFVVEEGASYWMQGSSSSASVIASIKFEAKDVSPVNVYDGENQIWNLTALSEKAYMFNTQSFTSIDGIAVAQLKAAPESISVDGVKASSANGTVIKVTPTANGELTAVFASGQIVISKQEERDTTVEAVLTSGTPFVVRRNTSYYLHGDAEALVTAIKVIEKEIIEDPIDVYDEESKSWNLMPVAEFADRFDTQNYTYIDTDKMVSVKSAPASITADGIKISKNSGSAIIRIIPPANGKITVDFTGTGVIMPDYEKREGGETAIASGEQIEVLGGVPYYLQGSGGDAATVTSINFEETSYELFRVTGIGFNKDYTKVLEFDIEKGDEYDDDITAVVCVFDENNTLKKVGVRKVSKSAMILGTNTIKCDIDITGYNKDTDKIKIYLWSRLS